MISGLIYRASSLLASRYAALSALSSLAHPPGTAMPPHTEAQPGAPPALAAATSAAYDRTSNAASPSHRCGPEGCPRCPSAAGLAADRCGGRPAGRCLATTAAWSARARALARPLIQEPPALPCPPSQRPGAPHQERQAESCRGAARRALRRAIQQRQRRRRRGPGRARAQQAALQQHQQRGGRRAARAGLQPGQQVREHDRLVRAGAGSSSAAACCAAACPAAGLAAARPHRPALCLPPAFCAGATLKSTCPTCSGRL
jgi:hypothetical protein